MDAAPRDIRYYRDPQGRIWFEEWFSKLRDRDVQLRIWARVNRLLDGNFGDHRALAGGVIELRLHVGPGYRVYVGMDGNTCVLLLLGGVKSGQARDIQRARAGWIEYLSRRSK